MEKKRNDKQDFYRKDFLMNKYMLETFRIATFGFLYGGLLSLFLYKMKSRTLKTAIVCSISGFVVSNFQTRLNYNQFTNKWIKENKVMYKNNDI